jgi:hypothetical protein
MLDQEPALRPERTQTTTVRPAAAQRLARLTMIIEVTSAIVTAATAIITIVKVYRDSNQPEPTAELATAPARDN